jgi:hypothetical protein
VVVHPPFAVDDQLAQQRDVGGRAAEAGDADARPLAGDRGQWRLGAEGSRIAVW